MNANPGDLVVCVDAKPDWSGPGMALVEGRVYRVVAVVAGITRDRCPYGYVLDGIVSRGLSGGYYTDRFRKLNDEPDNAELIALIKRPVRKGVSAWPPPSPA